MLFWIIFFIVSNLILLFIWSTVRIESIPFWVGAIIGLIRILLASAVMLAHIPANKLLFIDGQVAVLGFFIISGFYMNLVTTEKYQSNRSGFLFNRVLRLYPAYFIALALSILLKISIGNFIDLFFVFCIVIFLVSFVIINIPIS